MKDRKKLTPALLQALRPGAKVFDTEENRLFVRVSPKGRVSFLCQWHHSNAKVLGVWPDMTIDLARRRSIASRHETAERGAPVAVLNARGEGDKAPLTLQEFAEGEYAEWVATNQKRGDETLAALRRVWKDLLHKPLTAIASTDIERVKFARKKAGKKPATINRNLTVLSGCLTQAVKAGYLTKHPMEGVEELKGADNRTDRILTDAEEVRLRKALADREALRRSKRVTTAEQYAHSKNKHRRVAVYAKDAYTDHLMPLVLIALGTGCRRGELLSLEWPAVNLEGKVLTVRASTAKSQKTRHVPMSEEVHEVLTRWRKQSGGDEARGLVFLGRDGKARMDNFKKGWKALLEDAKISGFRYHDLRHTMASRAVMEGVPIYTLQKILGHYDAKMTERYAHLQPQNLAGAIALLDARRKRLARK